MKYKKFGAPTIALFIVLLTCVAFINTTSVKADGPPAYIISVYSYDIYVAGDNYDSDYDGEMHFRCSFDSDYDPSYYTGGSEIGYWKCEKYQYRSTYELLHRIALDYDDYVYLRLMEVDIGGEPDIVIDWKSKQVSELSWGGHLYKYYDTTGLWCQFYIIKEDNPYSLI